MTPFTLHLLRHGAPAAPGLLMGSTDGEPTAQGISDCLAKTFDLSVTRLVTSDLQRTSLAAQAIGAAIDLSPVTDARWRELDFGKWDGLAPDEVDPPALARFWSDPERHAPPGGERWSMLVARIAKAIADLAPQPTIVVTHGGAIRAALHVLCGFDQPQSWAFDLPYAALVSLRVWPGDQPVAQITRLLP
ncbi:histidine phosphatase family protein [Sphingomonas sp. RS6]